jgi:hypothetical protein
VEAEVEVEGSGHDPAAMAAVSMRRHVVPPLTVA